MNRDFEIRDGIYLSQSPYELDLHNDFDFTGLKYSIQHRRITLDWQRSDGDWVRPGTPATVSVEFREVSEFRFLPRDADLPFTEDDCLNTFGYWTEEDWADGVFVLEANQTPDPKWLTALEFMSGAVIAVQAASVHATIIA
jgi:hypothetical protein